ncbi:four helix bundle protein [Sulfurovum sp. ST-21]|uniref:Four helix bundle protein n=1 Tax=Sulfurovum indicum TaxID=2779528 RepID=A0A7M1S585_9BACT|nr:four helix bundle protein [Sulfurovum indicum]QOR62595.1 four helix bundle protein [Sulfurovum indicum]
MDYKELVVWQRSIELVTDIYQLVKCLPKEELFALSDQIKRCAVSIPSNIAEGSGRNTTKEFIQFLYISLGSASELETQLIIGKNVGFFNDLDVYFKEINEIRRMLNGLINSLKNKENR